MNSNVTFDKAAVPTFDAIQLTKSFKVRCNFLIWLYGFSSSTLNYLYNYSVLTNHNEFTVSATSAVKIFIKTFAYQLNLSLSLCTLIFPKASFSYCCFSSFVLLLLQNLGTCILQVPVSLSKSLVIDQQPKICF